MALSEELDRRIRRVDEAFTAVKAAFGMHLEHLADPELPVSIEEHHQLWGEMEASERAMDEAFGELHRRKDIRLGR